MCHLLQLILLLINYSFVYLGFDMWRIQWRHLLYNSEIQYGRRIGSAINYNFYLCKWTNLSIT